MKQPTFLLAACLLLAPAAPAAETGAANATPALSASIRAIRSLPDNQLRGRPRVTLRGVIAFHDARSGITYLQDDHGGIELRGLRSDGGWRSGLRVEISGTVDNRRALPGLVVETAHILAADSDKLPAAIPLSAEKIRTGELDGCRVELVASVFRFDITTEPGGRPWLRCEVASLSGHQTWLMPWQEKQPIPAGLLHAKVRCVGICEAIFNNRGQRIGELLFVEGIDDLEVLRPPPEDPFDRPTRSLAELGRPGLDDPFDRVRIEGVVLCQQKSVVNLLHVRTESGAIQVEAVGGDFRVGDRLAVVGYPVLVNKHIALREAVVLKLGEAPPPEPLEAGVSELLDAGNDSDLVRIRGNVVRNTLGAGTGNLFIESAGNIVEVLLSNSFAPEERLQLAQSLQPGAELLLTGVAELGGKMLTNSTVSLFEMRLTLRMIGDVTVVRAPPWWTKGRLFALAGVLAAGLALGGAWVLALRHRVKVQTHIIREKVGRETRWVERSRIARDIHDDVGSALTQITLLGDLGRRAGTDPAQVGKQFERISGQAREAVRALDAIVWTVNPKNDSLPVTMSYLCQMAQDLARDAGIRCRLEMPDELQESALGAKVRHNLLLAMKEAVHNIVKHSGAKVMRLRMECGPTTLAFEISDDGCGFDPAHRPAGRTGLDSMAQRMSDLGGSFELASRPGFGTTLRFALPWNSPVPEPT